MPSDHPLVKLKLPIRPRKQVKLQKKYLEKVDILEKEVLEENVQFLTNNIIIAKTFADDIRIANKKRASHLVKKFYETLVL